MIHFDEQNGPFCDAKRPILKIRSVLTVKKDGLFAFSEAFRLLKRKKNPTGFFGKIFRQFIQKPTDSLDYYSCCTYIVYGLSGLYGLFCCCFLFVYGLSALLF